MDVYAEHILEHYRSPRGKTADQPVGNHIRSHAEANRSCGDEITVHVQLNGAIIQSITWNGTGCAISQAAMSMLTEELTGKSVAEAHAMTPADVKAMLGIPVSLRREPCAILGLRAVQMALRPSHLESATAQTGAPPASTGTGHVDQGVEQPLRTTRTTVDGAADGD